MLTREEAADIPAEMAQQQAIAALGLSINQYMKTLQGRSMLESGGLFILGGRLYQGYNQRPVEPTEDQCTDAEIANAHDVDGTKNRIVTSRNQRLAAAAAAKDREQRKNRMAKLQEERDLLELAKLQREEAARVKADALDPEEPDPDSDPEPTNGPQVHACSKCGKTFGDARKLHAHKMGAKH